jgi:hypothetical protein
MNKWKTRNSFLDELQSVSDRFDVPSGGCGQWQATLLSPSFLGAAKKRAQGRLNDDLINVQS